MSDMMPCDECGGLFNVSELSPASVNPYSAALCPSCVEVMRLQRALQLIQKDPHQWTARPCPTCRTISRICGKPFGCSVREAVQSAPPSETPADE